MPICARPARAAASSGPGNSPGLRRREAYGARTTMPFSRGSIANPSSPEPNRAFTVEMRIGIDARELCGKPTGVGRHLAGLLNAWSNDASAARHKFVLYAHE